MPRHILALISLLVLGMQADSLRAADVSPPEGFTALFNGKDLSGWKGLVKDPKQRAAMTPDELAAEQAKREEDVRQMYKTVGRLSGLNVDAMEARANAERSQRTVRAR